MCPLWVGCRSKTSPEVQLQLARERAGIALGTESYTGLGSAEATLREATESLLETGRFEQLEKLISETESSSRRYGFLSNSQALYRAFSGPAGMDRTIREFMVERWVEESTTPKYAKLARAVQKSHSLLIDALSWHTMEERQRLGLLSVEAIGAIRTAERDPACRESAELWEAKLLTAIASGATSEICEKAFQECIARDPERWTAYAWRAYREVPKWTGKGAELYLAKVDQMSQEYGPEVYAACAWYRFRLIAWSDDSFRRLGYKWEKIDEGFEALCRRYPEQPVFVAFRARMALVFGKDSVAKELLEQLNGDVSSQAFATGFTRAQARELLGHDLDAYSRTIRRLPVGAEKELLDTVPQLKMVKQRADIGELLREEKFVSLEVIAERLALDEKAMQSFYEGCLSVYTTNTDEELEHRFNRWIQMVPNSLVRDTAKAKYLVWKAWDARGGDWASKVTPAGWKTFKSCLDEAAPLVESPVDSVGCTLRVTIAMGRNEPVSVVDRMLDLADKLDPKAVNPLAAKAVYLLPRWHGTRNQLVGFLEQTMEERGASSLLKVIDHSGYREAIVEMLPERMMKRATASALKATEDQEFTTTTAFLSAAKVADKTKVLEILDEIRSKNLDFEWVNGRYLAYREWARKEDTYLLPQGEMLAQGQYRATIPEPTLAVEGDRMPIVVGRSLGLRVRYAYNVSSFVTRTLELSRPGPNGPVQEVRTTYRVPYSMKKGQEELILWDLLPGKYDPGEWTLTVRDNGEKMAQVTFQMEKSEAPAEPGLRLEYAGRMKWDDEFFMGIPVPGPPEAKLGEAIGAMVSYVSKPKSVDYVWSLPATSSGRPGERQDFVMDCSGVEKERNPATNYAFIFEKADEVRSGLWKLGFKVNGRDIGEIDFRVRD